MQRLWKCNIWIAEFFEFYTFIKYADSWNVNNVVCVIAHRMLRDHAHLWITFVFVSNACVSLGITKTSPEDHGTLLAFHALRFVIFTQCERLSRRHVVIKIPLFSMPSSHDPVNAIFH